MSNSCLNAIKNCDIDTVIRTFVTNAPDSSIPLLAQSLRNLIRFVSTHLAIHSSRTAQSYSAKHMCLQRTNGASDGFLMFASNDDSLLPIACKYGQWDFTTMDEDSYDAICEFINCINGLYASQASQQDLELDMLPPEFYSNATCTVEQGDLTIIPILLNQKQIGRAHV